MNAGTVALFLLAIAITHSENDSVSFNLTLDSDEELPSTNGSLNMNATERSNVTKVTPSVTDPHVKTTIDGAARTTPVPPVVEFLSSEFCTCDLTVGLCDVNCCCDSDCVDEDRKVFSECLSHQTAMEDDRYCFQTDILFVNHTIYKMNHTNEGLFCIQYDNNKDTHFYHNVRPVTNETEFDRLYVRYVGNLTKMYDFELKYEMNEGDAILIVDSNGVVETLSIPSAFMSSRCEYMQPLLYLRDEVSSCDLDFEHSDFPFRTKVLEPKFYFQDFRVLKNQSVLNLLNLTEIRLTHEFPSSDELEALLVKVVTDCFDINGKAAGCNSTDVVNHVIKSVTYRIVHDGIHGVETVTATIYVTDIAAQIALPKITFQARYHWKNEDAMEPFHRSGNPGYIFGKPILAGNLLPNNNEDVHGNRSIRLNRDPATWMTLMSNGHCSEDNGTADRIPLMFGEDLRTSCLLELSYGDFEGENCFSMARLKWILEGSGLPEYVGMFGNSDPDKLDEWLPVIKGSDKIVSTIEGDTFCITLHLKIRMAYANVGSLSNPQAKIVGAMYWFEMEQLSFNCIGTYCGSSDRKLFEVSAEVQFMDVTRSSVPQFSAPPVFKARLPSDFFYPILSHGNSFTVNLFIFLSSVLICIIGTVGHPHSI